MQYLADKLTGTIHPVLVVDRLDTRIKLEMTGNNGVVMRYTYYCKNKKQKLFETHEQATAWVVSALQTDLEKYKKQSDKLRQKCNNMQASIKRQNQRLRLLGDKLNKIQESNNGI